MDKKAFLEALERAIGALPEQERARLLEYYGEMIDDRLEEGVPEAEAVAALGDPAEIAREFSPAARQAAGISESVGALEALRVRVMNADVSVVHEALANGAAAQLRFSDPERFEWRMEGDALVIEQRALEEEKFSLRWLKKMLSEPLLKVTVALADDLPGALEFASKGGDLSVDSVGVGGAAGIQLSSGDAKLAHVRVDGGLELNSASGDVDLDDVRVNGDAQLKSVSGDVEAANLGVAGALRLNSVSGDIALRELACGGLEAETVSGDIEIDRGRAGSTAIHSASGDVRLDELESDPELKAETASGDIDLSRCIARQTWLKTMSGDVDLRLEPLPCGYDLSATSKSGQIRLPHDNPAPAEGETQPTIRISTASGDVTAAMV